MVHCIIPSMLQFLRPSATEFSPVHGAPESLSLTHANQNTVRKLRLTFTLFATRKLRVHLDLGVLRLGPHTFVQRGGGDDLPKHWFNNIQVT